MQYLVLATDYDGTLAQQGRVDEPTLAALGRLRRSGRKIILVTGRERVELEAVFPQVGVCDLVVAENGGLLFWPGENREQPLGQPPPEAFLAEMRRLRVEPHSLGRVIFATWRPHEEAIQQTIGRLGIDYQIIFNKRAVMVLPSGVNKASGLAAALRQIGVAADRVVGIGDAENDLPFLETCAAAVAVENALPALKSAAIWSPKGIIAVGSSSWLTRSWPTICRVSARAGRAARRGHGHSAESTATSDSQRFDRRHFQQAHGRQNGDQQNVLDQGDAVRFLRRGGRKGLRNAGNQKQQQQPLGGEKPGGGDRGHGQPALLPVHRTETPPPSSCQKGVRLNRLIQAPTRPIANQIGASVTV